MTIFCYTCGKAFNSGSCPISVHHPAVVVEMTATNALDPDSLEIEWRAPKGLNSREIVDAWRKWNETQRASYRPDWREYFLGIADAVSKRGECTRRQVGAVLVKDNRIVSTGYNGAAPGAMSCLKGACPRAKSDVPSGSTYDTGPGTCIAVHAEANALLYASYEDRKNSTMYVSCAPCEGCLRLIGNSGVSMVVWPDGYWLELDEF